MRKEGRREDGKGDEQEEDTEEEKENEGQDELEAREEEEQARGARASSKRALISSSLFLAKESRSCRRDGWRDSSFC